MSTLREIKPGITRACPGPFDTIHSTRHTSRTEHSRHLTRGCIPRDLRDFTRGFNPRINCAYMERGRGSDLHQLRSTSWHTRHRPSLPPTVRVRLSIIHTADLIAARIYDKYPIGPSIRPICTRCCFTMTDTIQVRGKFY